MPNKRNTKSIPANVLLYYLCVSERRLAQQIHAWQIAHIKSDRSFQRRKTLSKKEMNEKLRTGGACGTSKQSMQGHCWKEKVGERSRGGQSLLYKQLAVVAVDAALPGATSLNVAAPFKLFVVYGPKGPKVILDSYKALV